jgi:arsenate reductase
MNRKKVLFICSHNRARSQMAEAFFNAICGEQFEAHSAGLEPGDLSPTVVEAMREIGMDISRNRTKSIFDTYKSGKSFAYVITVCDQSTDERRPIFPGITTRLHWSFPDPSTFRGSHEDRLARTREVRDSIKAEVEAWCSEIFQPEAALV